MRVQDTLTRPAERSAFISACPVCAGRRLTALFARQGYPIYRCRDCGLRFLNPPPDDSTLTGIYSAGYFLGERTCAAVTRVERLKTATGALYLDLAGRATGLAGGELLEIGCGNGEVLLEAQRRGFQVAGMDVSPYAAAIANQRLGAERVAVGMLGMTSLPESFFDLAIAVDVIEHVRDPLKWIRRIRTALKPGGVLLLATPSVDSWSARLMGRWWMEYKVEHLLYFGERSLRQALQSSGFSIVTLVPNVKVLSLDYINLHFERYPVPWITPVLALLRKTAGERLAHRHLALLASGITVVARSNG